MSRKGEFRVLWIVCSVPWTVIGCDWSGTFQILSKLLLTLPPERATLPAEGPSLRGGGLHVRRACRRRVRAVQRGRLLGQEALHPALLPDLRAAECWARRERHLGAYFPIKALSYAYI